MLVHTLTIVGVGLIGGSIGLAAKKRGLAQRVRGCGRDAGNLENARKIGAIDDAMPNLIDAVQDADLIIVCTPVDRIAEQILQASPHCKPGAILTDAGSTKQEIVRTVEARLPGHVSFIGGHPLAGSEKKGVDHAQADLFVERMTVLTPTPGTNQETTRRVIAFWQALGAQIETMSPQRHDQALALTSHLPHLLAAALASLLPDDWRHLAATGFRDTTRIASGDPEVWTPIFQHNRPAVLAALDLLEKNLNEFRQALGNNDAVLFGKLLTQGKKVRDALGS